MRAAAGPTRRTPSATTSSARAGSPTRTNAGRGGRRPGPRVAGRLGGREGVVGTPLGVDGVDRSRAPSPNGHRGAPAVAPTPQGQPRPPRWRPRHGRRPVRAAAAPVGEADPGAGEAVVVASRPGDRGGIGERAAGPAVLPRPSPGPTLGHRAARREGLAPDWGRSRGRRARLRTAPPRPRTRVRRARRAPLAGVPHGTPGFSDPGGTAEVESQLAPMSGRVATELGLDRGSDLAMEVGPPGGGHAHVDRLTDDFVGEPVAPGRSTTPTRTPAATAASTASTAASRSRPATVAAEREIDIAPRDGGHPQKSERVLTEALQLPCDHVHDRRRHVEAPFGHEEASDLGDEERVAVGAAMHVFSQHVGIIHPGPCEEPSDRRRRQPPSTSRLTC